MTCRDQATRWVHRYALGGAAFAALPLPVSSSAGLTALELHMLSSIARLYGEPIPSGVNLVAGTGLRVVGKGIKLVVKRVAGIAPIPVRPVIRGAAAALVIEAMGRAAIEYFESKYPNRPFSPS